MASVLAVRDTRDDAVHAMKLLLPVGEEAESNSRFRREFRALSRLQHPNVLPVYEWGMRGPRPWFTMELLQGQTLKDTVRDWANLQPAERFRRAESVLRQLAQALAYVHDRGLVHRDVTPSNIMVLPDGTAKIMDFGVVKDLGTDLTAVGEVVGTVAWISPEQIVGDAVDARADLYSLGATLYLMLTGQRPFQARTLQGYLEKHLHEKPRPPVELQPLVPPRLAEVCMRLLEKDPADRYASATHLLHVLGDGPDELDDDAPWPPRTVGRTPIRAQLRQALDDLAAGQSGASLLLSGPPGMGKTRLLDMAETYARRRGLRVGRGRCRPQDRPFGAFIGVYRGIGHELTPPVLRDALSGADDGQIRERYPVIAAFRDLVVERAPVVVILDDVEFADAATVEMMDYLVRNTLELHKVPVVYLFAQEAAPGTETVAGMHLLRGEATRKLVLTPFTPSEVEELVLSVLPNEPASIRLAERLHEVSEGSPAHLVDMLRALLDEGVLRREGARIAIAPEHDDITRSRLPMPASLREALKDRIAPLPPDALELARTVALSRQRLDVDTLAHALPFDDLRLMDALDVLVQEDLAVERQQGDLELVDLTQARLREVLLEDLPPDDLKRRHQALGEVLERHHRQALGLYVEELAWQFEQAGLFPKAYAYLRRTAHRHLNRSLWEEGLQFLDRAIRLEPRARPWLLLDDADRELAELWLARSTALYNLGRWSEALEAVQRAESLAGAIDDPRLQSRVAAEYGQQLRNQGSTPEAERQLRRALELAASIGDTSVRPMPLYHLGGLLWGKGQLDEAEVAWTEALTTARATHNERAMGYGFNGLGILAFCRGQSAEARAHLEQSSQLFERLGMLAPLAIARTNLAELYLATGVLRKALALAERTVAQAQEVHHSHGAALGLVHRAQSLMELGRTEEARQNAAEALRLVRALGTNEDELIALATLARVHLARREYAEALAAYDELDPMLASFDPEGIGPQLDAEHALALAAVGRSAEARALLARSPVPERAWPHVRVRTALAHGRALAALGDLQAALPLFEAALTDSEAGGYRLHQLQAQQALAELHPDPAEAAKAARTAVALARSVAANLALGDRNIFLERGWGAAGR
jgi:tetratricopeptide (TPR) repeat protein/tRNA A-37 threonylcarbamoyl transferase component Bud32